MKKILCFDATEIYMKEYIYYPKIQEFYQSTVYNNNGEYYLIPVKVDIIFEKYGLPLIMRKVFFICDTNKIVNFEKIGHSKEIITDYPVKMNLRKKTENKYIGSNSQYGNIGLNGGTPVSYEYLINFFNMLKMNPLLAEKYFECLKEITSINFKLSLEDIMEYIEKEGKKIKKIKQN